MRDETKKYLRSTERKIQNPAEDKININNKILEIVNLLNNQLSVEQRGDFFNGNLNTPAQLIDQWIDFIRLNLKYMIFDNESLKREIAELHNLLEGDDTDNCDLAS